MLKNIKNTARIEGWLYQHKLEKKVTGANSKAPGTEYIRGNIDIATDDAMTNIVSIYFTYVTPKTSSGKDNSAYPILANIMAGTTGNVMQHGVANAVKMRIDTSIALNEFYSDRNGTEELVSAKRLDGGFLHIAQDISIDESQRNEFEEDMIITKFIRTEADEEKNRPERGTLKGFIFNFRKDILPVEFEVLNPAAMNYFEDLEATDRNPVFTKVKGKIISQTVVNKRVEEGAFGEPKVIETPFTRRAWVVDWAAKETYEWDDENTITKAEFKKCLENRAVTEASIKANHDNYKASQNAGAIPAAAATSTTKVDGFDF